MKGSLNALKPQLNLVGIVQNSGMAGDLNPLAGTPTGAVNPGGYGTALGQLFRRDFPTYGVGIQLTLPLRNRVAQADAVRDELQVRQTEVRRQQLQDQVRLEVADAEESLREARAAYDAAVEARRLQEQSVSVEQQTFAVGTLHKPDGDPIPELPRAGPLDGGRIQRGLHQGEDCPAAGNRYDSG